MSNPRQLPAALIGFAVLCAMPAAAKAEPAEGLEFFEKRIRPVLVKHCYECHSAAAAEPKGGLLLDTREALLTGGESGPAVVPGSPDESLLVSAVRQEGLEMPPSGRRPDEVIDDLVEWIRSGAPDPRVRPAEAADAAAELWAQQFDERRRWWSLQPVRAAAVPEVRDSNWSGWPMDRFVLARLEEEGLRAAPRADRGTLVRRLSFALTGLPPSPQEVEAFVSDSSAGGWERLVDRLLASPHFGERWARHWMDVVRYTDTYGYEWDIPAKGAWRYRDYLVRAFNADVPFDQLLREQIAGDLLENPRLNQVDQINESLIGLMFYQMGEKRHGDSAEFNGIHQEMLDNKIDAFGKAFQATTISCARCHDHKLDAVAQREYYALGGALISSRWVTNTVDLPQRQETARRELAEIKSTLRPLLGQVWQGDVGQWTAETWRHQRQAHGEAELPLENPLHPWFVLQRAADAGTSIAEAWTGLAKQHQDEHGKRTANNAAHFSLVADFRQGIPPGWSVDGVGLADVVARGDFTVALEGDAAVSQILHGGLDTHALSPRMNGAIRTPWLNTLEAGHLSFEVSGGHFAARRTVVDNAFLTERQQYIDQKHPAWQMADTLSAMRDRHIYIELATKTSNPNFPPRVGLGGACSEEQAADPRSWFGVTRVVRHQAPSSPLDELARFVPLFAGPPPATLDEAAGRYAAWIGGAVDGWCSGQPTDDQVRLLNWALDAGLLFNRRDAASHPQIAELVDRYRRVEARLSEPWTVNGMADVDPGFDYRLNVRGDYDQLGEAVGRGYLAVIAEACGGDSISAAVPHGGSSGDGAARDQAACFNVAGSGRGELAELIASPSNPLTARVFVNRVWHWLFGAGIVATVDDFGHIGELPSHPELLDYLAARFMAEGWSLKTLVREIVLSETFCQSQAAESSAAAVDPSNRLLHHYPVRRLDAESIRDAMLWVSGRLDRRLFGPPLNPYRLNEDAQKRLFSGPLDGDGRRSIYTKVTIMEPPRFLATFNQPAPKIPTGKRDVTTTPAQSLTLLNDPFVAAQAEYWAGRLLEHPVETAAQRVAGMFMSALGRP
ncbi:MAG: PSD1 and planctomycete cytochrome C domain-containing protein, partial [Phycisphaeraceae bacterium]